MSLMYNNKTETARISVIVPVFNVEPYLDKCIKSIVSQTYSNLEVILVNDGSTDGSGAICKYFESIDQRVVVVHENANSGVSAARNIGLDKAIGEYICFVDADDYLELDMIEILYSNMLKHSALISCGNVWMDFRRMSVISKQYDEKYILLNSHSAIVKVFEEKLSLRIHCKMFSRRVFEEIRFPVDMIYCEDVYTLISAFAAADVIIFDTRPLYHYRQRAGSAITLRNEKTALDLNRAFEHICEVMADEATAIKVLCQQQLMKAHINAVASLVCCKKYWCIPEYVCFRKKIIDGFPRIKQSDFFSNKYKVFAHMIVILPAMLRPLLNVGIMIRNRRVYK